MRETGSVAPEYVFCICRRKINKNTLQKAVKKKLDAYLSELTAMFRCSIQAVFYALKKMNITLKKTFIYAEKSEEKRDQFVNEAARIPEEKHVYVDESGVNKCLICEYGHAPRDTKVEDVKHDKSFKERTRQPQKSVERLRRRSAVQKYDELLFVEWFYNTHSQMYSKKT